MRARTARWRRAVGLVALGSATALGLSAMSEVRADDGTGSAASSDALTEMLVKFKVTGTFERFDPEANVVTFAFAGPFFAAGVGDRGLIDDTPGRPLGRVEGARVEFTPGTTSDTFRFTCDDCEFRFDDGAVVRPLLDDPATPWHEMNIPMEGRMFVELGPVPGADATMINLRGAGCGGAREIAGRGRVANMNAGICVNGVFGFPAVVRSLSPAALIENRERLAEVRGFGESDCTLVFHTPTVPTG